MRGAAPEPSWNRFREQVGRVGATREVFGQQVVPARLMMGIRPAGCASAPDDALSACTTDSGWGSYERFCWVNLRDSEATG